MMELAPRMKKIPPYLFAQLDKVREEEQKKGGEIYSLAIGDPVEPTPPELVEFLAQSARRLENHRYSPYAGILPFRKAAADWYKERFDVSLDPEKEVLTLIGSKEGIAHIFLAFVGSGDRALIPDPGYPVYRTAVLMADGEPYSVPLLEKNDFLPEFGKIPEDIARSSKILFLCYPNNPTAAVVSLDFLKEAVEYCRKRDILLCYDNAYSEITYDGYVAPSILQVPHAKEIAVEFNSLSKPYNMTGWRLGYAVGNEYAIQALGVVKNNIDSSAFMALQEAGIFALKNGKKWLQKTCDIHKKRRDLLVETLRSAGLQVRIPKGTFYLWVKVPNHFSSAEFAAFLLKEARVMTAPGTGYGEFGEGYVRFSTTVPDDLLQKACHQIREACREKKMA